MTSTYDSYYKSENLFGDPYPELIQFFTEYTERGKVLDLGCGQGRDAIALARLGYMVTGIDQSEVGIEQMNQIGRSEGLSLEGKVQDLYSFETFEDYDIILMDSMFHFAKKDKEKEVNLIKKIVTTVKKESLIVVFIQDIGNRVQILNDSLDFNGKLKRLADKKLVYVFEDKVNGHKSTTDYRMLAVEK